MAEPTACLRNLPPLPRGRRGRGRGGRFLAAALLFLAFLRHAPGSKNPRGRSLLQSQLLVLQILLLIARSLVAGSSIEHDAQNKRIILSDAKHNLVLRLNYDCRCVLDQVSVMGRQVVREETGVCSAIKVGDQWFTTRTGIPLPKVSATSNTVTITGIDFGAADLKVSETWRFTVHSEYIVWRVERSYLNGGTIGDTYFPGWDFQEMSTWTGALLGNGGVAWAKLFDTPNASYGVHNGSATFWNKDHRACLRITPSSQPGNKIAVRFSRQPSGAFS